MENGFSSTRTDTFPAGLRVLVVDDDPTWLKILEKMLKKCSYEVTTCGLARDALKLLRERKDGYDIVISDVNMPDMDGFKLLEHVGLEMDLPVIMMSVDGETNRVMKGVRHGACDYLLKPIRMKELKNIWQHVLRKKIHEVRYVEILDGIENIQMTTRTGSDQSDDGNLLFGEDLTSPKKRKDAENKHDDNEPGDSSSMKKARMVWSVDLHQKFVKAVDQIGLDKVGPKKILDLMNVPWLTRENVASHLQKYRLYLSRLQKENNLKQCAGMVKLLDSPLLDSTASFSIQNQINLQQKNITIGSYEYPGNSSLVQNAGPRSLESDRRKSVQMSVAQPRRDSDINFSSPHHPRSSLGEFGHSFTPPKLEVKPTASNSTFTMQYSWCDVAPGQLKLESKPPHVADNFSQLQQCGQWQHMQTDYLQPAPQVTSRISKTERGVGGSLNIKTFEEHRHNVNVSSVWSLDNARLVETKISVPNHQATVPILHDALSMKYPGLPWDCIAENVSAQKHVNLGVSSLATLDENLPLCFVGSNCFSTSLGVQNIEFPDSSRTGIIAEVPINLYAGFDYENQYDPAEYPLLDQGLFIA